MRGPITRYWQPSISTIRRSIEARYRGEEVFQEETKVARMDGSVIDVLFTTARPGAVADKSLVGFIDITERKRAEEALRESERRFSEAQMELAHANRVTTMGQLTASIAHEVNQPIAAALTNAQAGLRWLGADPPNLEEVRQAFGRIVENTGRAGDVIGRIRALIKKVPPRKGRFDLNEAVRDVIALTGSEVLKHGVSAQTDLATDLPLIEGDRVQLQQVILNLIMNAVEAMSGISEGPRELRISTETEASGAVLVSVRDTGPRLDPQSLEQVFEAFYTTKASGLGMGLAICRSIIEAHGGRLWASPNEPQGVILEFTLPPWNGTVAEPKLHAPSS
jgi:C4-dicarboxylate-specific signal transduction histidine kinase